MKDLLSQLRKNVRMSSLDSSKKFEALDLLSRFEEITDPQLDRKRALAWWDKLPLKGMESKLHYAERNPELIGRTITSFTGREIENLWKESIHGN